MAVVVDRHLHNVANYLVASLAITDLTVASLVLPFAALQVLSSCWFLGSLVCDIWISVDVLCCTSSILHLVAIAVDRYWAVTRVDYIRKRSHRRTIGMVVTIWVISVSISIPPLFGWKDGSGGRQPGPCIITQDWGYTVYSTIGAFYLPLAVIIFFYAKIFQAARARIRKEPFRNRRHLRRSMFNAATSTDYETTCAVADDMVSTVVLTTNASIVANTADGVSPATSITNGNATPSPHRVVVDVSHSGGCDGSGKGGGAAAGNGRGAGGHRLRPTTFSTASPKPGGTSPHTRAGNGEGGALPAQMHHRREKLEQRRERKAARTLAIVTGCFVVCWLPFFVVAVVRPFCGIHCKMPDVVESCINWLGYCNSLANPIIYTVFNADFRKAFRKILCRRCS